MLGRLALVIAERADGVLTIEHRPQLAGLPFLYVVHTICQHARRSLPPLANFPSSPVGGGSQNRRRQRAGAFGLRPLYCPWPCCFRSFPSEFSAACTVPVVRCAESPVVR